jgi:hypothetical protein
LIEESFSVRVMILMNGGDGWYPAFFRVDQGQSVMSFYSVAAERVWFAVAPDGSGHEVAIRVMVPTKADRGEWRAAVSIGGTDSRPCSIAGIDSWQAICLAMSFSATRLGHFAEDGWAFYWEREGEAAIPEDLASAPYSL